MRFHYQNLNDRPPYSRVQQGPLWRHGRAWLISQAMDLNWEWLAFPRNFRLEIKFGSGDYQGWSLSISLPLLFSIWITLGFSPLKSLIQLPVPHGEPRTCDDGSTWRPVEPRRFSIYTFGGRIGVALWEREHEWRSEDPWWVRGVSWGPADMLGPHLSSRELLKDMPITIPLPEGVYEARATLERVVSGRKYGRKRVSLEWGGKMPSPGPGLPCPGKYGRDGLYGWSAESRNGDDVEKLIAAAVKSVLHERRRYASIDWIPTPEGVAA